MMLQSYPSPNFLVLLLIYIAATSGSKLCLIPTKSMTPWTILDPQKLICPMDSARASKVSTLLSKTMIDLDTTDVFSTRKVMGTSSTLMQFETCCTNNPLWLADEITHNSYTIESNTFQAISEGIPAHPDPICNKDMFYKNKNCNSQVFKIDRQDIIYYSPIHGFPENYDCDLSNAGVVSCKDTHKHSTFIGTFPSISSKVKNCPIKWVSAEAFIHKEDSNYYVDFVDIRVSRGKIVCRLDICNTSWLGLSQGLLVRLPSGVDSSIVLGGCDTSFNYEFDISAAQHEEIKTGLKELKKNARCELLRQTEDRAELLTSLLIEWETFYPQRPGIHQSYRVNDRMIYQSIQLFELVDQSSVSHPEVWDTCPLCGKIKMENGSLHLSGSVLEKNESTIIKLSCSESIDLRTAIKIKEKIKDMFFEGAQGKDGTHKYMIEDNVVRIYGLSIMTVSLVLIIVLVLCKSLRRKQMKLRDAESDRGEYELAPKLEENPAHVSIKDRLNNLH